ncbi:hypothetical protein ACGFNV_35065 [Streptomyces sp. NPDC048751]|uniref:hypothetical protein n=1 Tax=Streptomyces sp. NPDC048751 TaxID=3365591 RepID=UPI00371854F9
MPESVCLWGYRLADLDAEVVYGGLKEVARHERLLAKGKARLELDHSLEALVRKPGAFPGGTALNRPAPQASSHP